MKRNHLIALAIITVVFLATFNFAYLDIQLDKPFVQLLSFLGLIIGSIAAWFVGNKEEATHA